MEERMIISQKRRSQRRSPRPNLGNWEGGREKTARGEAVNKGSERYKKERDLRNIYWKG